MTLWDQILCWQATETPTLLGLSEKGSRRCPRPQPGTMGTTGSKVLRGGEQHPAQLGSLCSGRTRKYTQEGSSIQHSYGPCALEGPGSTPRRGAASSTARVPVLWKDPEVHPGGRRHHRPPETLPASPPQTGSQDQ